MRDFMYLGETPSDESCVQVGAGDGGYTNTLHMRQEQQVMIRYLRRLFGLEPQGAALKIRSEQHDFGELLTIVCEYRDDEPRSVEYAFKLEKEWPERWDEIAVGELQALGIPLKPEHHE